MFGKVAAGSALFGTVFGITDGLFVIFSDPLLLSYRERVSYCAIEIAVLLLAGLIAGLLLASSFAILRRWTGKEPCPAFIRGASLAALAAGALLVCCLTWMTGIAAYALALLLMCRFFLKKNEDHSSARYLLLCATLPIMIRAIVFFLDRYDLWLEKGLYLSAFVGASLILLLIVSLPWKTLRENDRMFPRLSKALLVLFSALTVLIIVLLLLPAPPRPPRREDSKAPNLLFILVDALRRDHLGAYGYPENVSPTVDRLAREGAFFTTVVSAAPHTVTSMPSIMTSQFPCIHGVDMRGEYEKEIPAGLETLAEMLSRRGYMTAAFVANPYIQITGLDRGFQEFHDLALLKTLIITGSKFYLRCMRIWGRYFNYELMYPIGGRLNRRVISWLGERSSEPFFLFVHYMDVHNPYIPPRGFSEGLGDVIEGYFDAWEGIKRGETEKREERLDLLKRLYDREILYMDSNLKEVLAALDELGMRDNTLIVLAADHGDEFYEHGDLGHNQTLYDEVLLVPLIFNMPGRIEATGAIGGQFTTMDLLPTALSILGLPVPSGLAGVSLYPFNTGWSTRTEERVLYSESRDYISARMEGWKLIRAKDSGREELYDLKNDPLETVNVRRDKPDMADKLGKALNNYRAMKKQRQFEPRPAKVTDEAREQLEALGYIVK